MAAQKNWFIKRFGFLFRFRNKGSFLSQFGFLFRIRRSGGTRRYGALPKQDFSHSNSAPFVPGPKNHWGSQQGPGW